MIIEAKCHCGNIELRMITAGKARKLHPVTCPCRFCTLHGARHLSDARGNASISIRDHDQLIRYRFGTESADFLICKRCGIYVAAVIMDGDQCWSALNLNLTDQRELPASQDIRWQRQSHDERIAFRKTVWTPTVCA